MMHQQQQQRQSVHTDMMKNPITFILVFFVISSVSQAQDNSDLSIPPSSLPTSVGGTSSIIPSVEQSQSPSAAIPYSASSKPTATNQPTSQPTSPVTISPTNEICRNHPDFVVERWAHENSDCTWSIVNRTCDDVLVSCYDYGNLGPATDYCCKCKSECTGQCNDRIYSPPSPSDDDDDSGCFDTYYDDGYYDDYYIGDIPVMILTFFAIGVLAVCARRIYRYNCQGQPPPQPVTQQIPDWRDVLGTLTPRPQQQRENNNQGLTEEERNNTRYELFVTKFYFQAVLPDRSNVTANSLRSSSSSNPVEEHKQNDGEGESSSAGRQPPLSKRLPSWRRPSAKDECCICLERYTEGETICVPITTECNHVFHEGCILEWLKTKDHCPLCRVELLKD